MKTFEKLEKHFATQLCLVQQYFDGIDYLQAIRSLLNMRGEEESRLQQKWLKKSHGWTGFEKGFSSQLYDDSEE